MNPEAESFKIEVGQLTQTSFASEQERAEAIAAQLKVTPIDGNLPSKGEKGDPGDAWERVSDVMKLRINEAARVEMLKGCIGSGAAVEFNAFLVVAFRHPVDALGESPDRFHEMLGNAEEQR